MEQVSNYNKAFCELYEILKYMNNDIKNMIPENIKLAIKNSRDKDYEFKYNKDLALYEQNIFPETKALLSVIYSEYLCDEAEKRKWDEYDKFEQEQKEKIIRDRYNLNDLFEDKKEELNYSKDEEIKNLPIEVKKENIFQKIISYVKKLFNK